jgi:hypothetical protein
VIDDVRLGVPRNLRRDPRVSLSFEAPGRNEYGLDHYLVLHGRARVTAGGAPELLGRLAKTYLGAPTWSSRRCRTRRLRICIDVERWPASATG